jgi:hypothetical protein
MIDQLSIDCAVDRSRDIERLVPIARELAEKARGHGVTIADVRIAAVNRGILTGDESGRRLSFLGVVMRKAGLTATNEYRRSHITKSHGNPHRVFVLPEYSQRRAS